MNRSTLPALLEHGGNNVVWEEVATLWELESEKRQYPYGNRRDALRETYPRRADDVEFVPFTGTVVELEAEIARLEAATTARAAELAAKYPVSTNGCRQ